MNILFPELLRFSDAGLPLLRLMVACVFFTSGLNHLKAPAERAKGIGLILIMLGAIQKKIFVWKTGFWGKGGSGWHYDLMLLVMNLVIVVTRRRQARLVRVTNITPCRVASHRRIMQRVTP